MDNKELMDAMRPPLGEDDLGDVTGGTYTFTPVISEDCSDYCDSCSGGAKTVTLGANGEEQLTCAVCQKVYLTCPVCGAGWATWVKDAAGITFGCSSYRHKFTAYM